MCTARRPDVAGRVRPRSARLSLRGETSVAALPAAEVMSAWEKAAVIADSAAALGIVLTLFYSIWSFRTTLRDSYYAELDRVYFDLLRIGLEHPELLDFPASRDPGKAREYDAYAFIVSNLVAT